jgi:signal transduction histidine kinase
MLRPRTIRGQLMAGLILFEVLVLAVFSIVLVSEQRKEMQLRTERRLTYQASMLAIQSSSALEAGQLPILERVVAAMRGSPSIAAAQVTDMQGRVLVSSDPTATGKLMLLPNERNFLRELDKTEVFSADGKTREAVAPVRVRGKMQGLVWIYSDDTLDRSQLQRLLIATMVSAAFGILACTVFASLMARSIARPLGVLMRATRQLVRDPEDTASFPLEVTAANEAADLTRAFNLMVASIQEQRAGLNDTLALLDSMLANAPIGLAFFDSHSRFVRVNQFMARLNQMPVSRHLGQTAASVFPESTAQKLTESIEYVFAEGHAVRDLELEGETGETQARTQSWLANVYPVRTEAQTVRWVGVILVETTERRRSEEALRRTEKLAAAGRLAASIAHEINNPLEAVTNLLYLIRSGPLDAATAGYAEMAAHEVARVSEITQQTLRFYRQSTLPAVANVGELLDSVLTLHHGRTLALQVELTRSYGEDVSLFCFAGELRQLFANLIGNALDAMTVGGGRLMVRVRRTHSWREPRTNGVRVTIADTGVGMPMEVRRRIFEPFFTTKEATGTGLGLWVSDEIIRKHHGVLKVRSRVRSDEVAGGTVFSLFFPEGFDLAATGKAVELQGTAREG